MNNKPSDSVISWKEKIGYAVGDTASCLYWQTFSVFLMIFYTDTFGLAPAVAGTMLMVSRIADGFIDPMMGLIADRTKSRWGKFRPWLLWGIIPFGVSGVLVFITPDLGPTGKLIYACLTYNLVMIVYSLVNVPYGSLLGVISPSSHDRTTLASFRFVGAFGGNIIVSGSLLYLVEFFGKGNTQVGYPMAVGVYAVLAGLLFFTTFITTKERVSPPKVQSSVKEDFSDLSRNRPWIVLCCMGLATLIYVSVRNNSIVYYFKYYMGSETAAASFMVIGQAFSVLGALLTPSITRLFRGDKRRTFIALSLFCGVMMGLTYFVEPSEVFTIKGYVFSKSFLLFATQLAMSVCNAAMMPLIWSMYADTADYGQWKFGRRATGLVFSAATFSQKVGWAVGGGVFGFLLGGVGFVANQAQSETALTGIRHMMSTIPAGLTLVAVVISFAYNLTPKLEEEIKRHIISARDAEAKG